MPRRRRVHDHQVIAAPALRAALRQLPDLHHAHDLLRARRRGGEVLERAARGEQPPGHPAAQRLQPLQQRPVRVDRDASTADPRARVSSPGLGRRPSNSPGRRLCSPTSTTIVSQAARCRQHADSRRHGRLADASLAGDDEQLAVERRSCIVLQSLSESTRRARAGRRGTYNRLRHEPPSQAERSIDELVSYDGDGLVPCVVQDWSTGEVLTLAYMNEQALLARARAASCTCGAARATSNGTRAPPAATSSACGRCAWTATATPCSRSSSPPGPPATPASAPAFTAAS